MELHRDNMCKGRTNQKKRMGQLNNNNNNNIL